MKEHDHHEHGSQHTVIQEDSYEYWVGSLACSVYFLNRSPMIPIKDMIPEEAWSGRKTSVAHLRVLCSFAFSPVPDELRKNMDKKSKKCIFTSYGEQKKAYKLYNHVTKKIVVSRDMKFVEDKCYSDPSDIQQQESLDLSDLPIKLPRLEVQQKEETPVNNPSQNQKTKNLRELYEQTPLIDE